MLSCPAFSAKVMVAISASMREALIGRGRAVAGEITASSAVADTLFSRVRRDGQQSRIDFLRCLLRTDASHCTIAASGYRWEAVSLSSWIREAASVITSNGSTAFRRHLPARLASDAIRSSH